MKQRLLLGSDNALIDQKVARDLGLHAVRAELMPDDKVTAIRELASGQTVAMVGDGVNDAPALAAADLTKLPEAIRLGRLAERVIQQNIVFAVGEKLLFLALAAGGWATLWMAIAADMGASLLVIFNGLRLLKRA